MVHSCLDNCIIVVIIIIDSVSASGCLLAVHWLKIFS